MNKQLELNFKENLIDEQLEEISPEIINQVIIINTIILKNISTFFNTSTFKELQIWCKLFNYKT